jgi:PIN domain nuclease of toxin-antitoxin system
LEPALPAVLDSSSLIAAARQEPGAARVEPRIRDSAISAVNWSEFLQKATVYGLSSQRLVRAYLARGLTVASFSSRQARLAADLWPSTHRFGISLADRACMALAIDLGLPILTADRRWIDLGLPVPVESIR